MYGDFGYFSKNQTILSSETFVREETGTNFLQYLFHINWLKTFCDSSDHLSFAMGDRKIPLLIAITLKQKSDFEMELDLGFP